VPGPPRLDLAATERKGAGWGGRATVRHLRVFCVFVCVRARVRICTCVRHTHSTDQPVTFVFVCVFVDDSLYCKAAPFSVCCVHLAVLGTVGGGLASSAHEWLLQHLGAATAQRGIARCVLRPWHLVLKAPVSSVKPRGPT
jgi:hypothetical protein